MPKLKLIDIEAFRADAKAGRSKGRRPEGGIIRAANDSGEDVGNRTLRYRFSDGSIDRAGDTINPDGWDLTSFEANPVALWAHMSSEPPIGRASKLAVEKGVDLKGDITFATREEYPFADTIYRLSKGGFINAVSVGFIPLEWDFAKDKDRPFGLDFVKQELLEISLCPVPCNANALGEARSAGIDVAPLIGWAEKLLDCHDGKILIPKAELEALRRKAGGGRVYHKAGRALSKRNEDDLRTAAEKINAVLASVEQQDEDPEDPKTAPGEPEVPKTEEDPTVASEGTDEPEKTGADEPQQEDQDGDEDKQDDEEAKALRRRRARAMGLLHSIKAA